MLTTEQIRKSQKILNEAKVDVKSAAKTLEEWNKKRDNWKLKIDDDIKTLIVNIDKLMWDTTLQGQSYQYAAAFMEFSKTIVDKINTLKTIGYDDVKIMHSIFSIQTFGGLGSIMDSYKKCSIISETYDILIKTSEEIDYFDYMIKQLNQIMGDFEKDVANVDIQKLSNESKDA